MCMPAGSSTAAPTTTVTIDLTAGGAGAYAPDIGGDAEVGVRAIAQETCYDPWTDTHEQVAAGLAEQLQQAQAMLVVDVQGAGGAQVSFRIAVEEREPVQLQQMHDGAAAMANLDVILEARERRVARLTEALGSDPNATAEDAKVLEDEQRLLEETRQLRDKLAPLAETIDQQEAASILRVVGTASERGSYGAEDLAELMIQVEGSAHGLPTSYIESAIAVQEQLKQSRAELEQVTQELAANPQLAADPAAQQLVQEMQEFQDESQETLRANFELAKRDPATAQAQLEAFATAA